LPTCKVEIVVNVKTRKNQFHVLHSSKQSVDHGISWTDLLKECRKLNQQPTFFVGKTITEEKEIIALFKPELELIKNLKIKFRKFCML